MKGLCPVCDSEVKLSSDLEVSELVTCQECQSRLVVSEIDNPSSVVLEEAPEVEEDWGE